MVLFVRRTDIVGAEHLYWNRQVESSSLWGDDSASLSSPLASLFFVCFCSVSLVSFLHFWCLFIILI